MFYVLAAVSLAIAYFYVGKPRLARRKATPPPAVCRRSAAEAIVDPTFENPLAVQHGVLLQQRKWEEAHDFLAGIREPNSRFFYVDVLSTFAGRAVWLDEWVTKKRNDSEPFLVRGANALRWAWEAGGGGAEHLWGADQRETFVQRLELARKELETAIQIDPDDPTPWAYLTRIAMDLKLPESADRAYFKGAIARAPQHQMAHFFFLPSLGKKSGGSHEKMFAFARERSSTSTLASPLYGLIAKAHIERWLCFSLENDIQGDRGYFSNPAVVKEIVNAASLSVLSPDYPSGPAYLHQRELFTFCFRAMERFDLAATQIPYIGGSISEFPWGYLDQPEIAYRDLVQRCSTYLSGSTRRAENFKRETSDGVKAP